MSCVKLVDDFERVGHEGSPILAYSTGFFFDVPESIALPLPPSIRAMKSDPKAFPALNQDNVMGSCDIIYWIEARLSTGRCRTYAISREIIVMPVSEMPPPLDTMAFGKEYRLFAISSIRPFWRRRKEASLSVCSHEPRPLIFAPNKNSLADTELFLNFSRSSLEGNNANYPYLQLTHCEIVMTLVATTYFLGYEEKRILSLAEAQNCTLGAWKETRYKMPKRRLKLANWKEVEGATKWESSACITVLIPDTVPRLPSFFSTLASRRYAFAVEIRLGNESGAFTHKTMKLRVPVQLIHAPREKDSDGFPELEFEDDMKPPAYIP